MKYPISRMHILSAILLTVISIALRNPVYAQNLVPNPGFEVFSTCPSFGNFGFGLATQWYSASSNSLGEYYHECATFWPYAVPNNGHGSQFARTGAAYIGVYAGDEDNFSFERKYAQVPLADTLQAGLCYKVGCYISLADYACAVNHFGILLTPNPVVDPLGMTPQVDFGGVYYTDDENWVLVFNYVLAEGDEAYLTIGNFHSNAESIVDPACGLSTPDFRPYYFVDDVFVEEVPASSIDVELDAQVTACDSFVIEAQIAPEADDVLFIWSHGVAGSPITVTESGEYTVTAYYGCSSDVASIEVEIIHPPVFGLGNDTVMCAGETFTISLDPSLGDIEWQDGSGDAEYTIDATGQYIASIDNGCLVVADTIDVLVVDPPAPVSLGDQLILCPDDVHQYDFDPLLGDFEWQDGSVSPTFTIAEAGTYSLTITTMCGESSDDVVALEVVPPSFDLGPDTLYRCAGEIIDIELDHTMGSFQWQNGSNSNSFTITTSGVYSVTVSNPCGVVLDSIVAIYTSSPMVDLGADTMLCEGDTLVLDGGNHNGAYAWQDGSSMTTYTATTSGTYSLTVTNQCGIDRDTMGVLFASPPPQPDLGVDRNLCPGETITLGLEMPGGTITWSDSSSADTLVITVAGTYHVQVMNACGVATDTVMITASADPPVVQLPADLALCAGDTLSLHADVAGVTYTWNDGSQGQDLHVTAPGFYSVTVANNCGSDTDTIVVMDGGSAPTLSLGVDTAICEGSSFIILPDATNVDTWLWQDGSMSNSYSASLAGAYFVVGQNACGEATDTLHVSLLPVVPALWLGPDTALCDGDVIELLVSVTNVDILWHDGSVDAVFQITGPGMVYAMISNSCGESADTVLVSQLPGPPALDLGADVALCPGEIILFDPGIPGVTYTWQDGSTNPTYQSIQAETIILTIASPCGSAVDTVQVLESTMGPVIDLGPDRSACAGDTVIVSAGLAGVDYLWQDGSMASGFIATKSGTIILQVSNNCGTDADTIEVIIAGDAPVIELGADTLLCDNNTLLLKIPAVVGDVIRWQDGSASANYLVTQPGVYFVEAVNMCGSGADTIHVSYLESPAPFSIGPDTVLCKDEMVLLQRPVTPFDFAWQDGSDGETFLVTQPGIYSGAVVNACGQADDTVVVSYITENLVLDLDTLIYWCVGEHIELDATQSFPATYAWSTGALTPSIIITSPGRYGVDVQTRCDTLFAETHVIADPLCRIQSGIFIPNVFSPNGDQVNDVFSVQAGSDVTVLSMTGAIYDRWGGLVFSSTAVPFTWDGRFDQQAVMPGVYVYRVAIRYAVAGSEFTEVLSGDVTVVR